MFASLRRLVGMDPETSLRRTLGDMELPSFSQSTQALLGALRDPETPMSRIGDLLAADPGLSVKVLRIANRASNGLRRPIADAAHATRLLGREEIESLVIAAAVQQASPKVVAQGFDTRRFWRHASLRAAVAKEVCDHVDPASARQAFTAALLQDMALPLLVKADPQDYRSLLRDGVDHGLEDRERARYGWDHAQVAGWLCASWKLPAPLTGLIVDHHEEHAAPALRVAHHAPHDDDDDRFVEQARTHVGLLPEAALGALQRARVHARELHAALA